MSVDGDDSQLTYLTRKLEVMCDVSRARGIDVWGFPADALLTTELDLDLDRVTS